MMKAALAIHHRRIPLHPHFREPNDRIAWDTLPVRVPTETVDWPDLAPGAGPHAGVSSFGMSGTNVHVVLGSPPKPSNSAPESWPSAHVLSLSARSDASLRTLAGRYADALDRPGGPSIGDVCYTVNTTRYQFDRRAAFVAEDAAGLVRSLREFEAGQTPASCVTGNGEPALAVIVESPETDVTLRNLAESCVNGGADDWAAFYEGFGFRRVPLPSYPFERKRLWLDAAPSEDAPTASNASSGSVPAATVEPREFLSGDRIRSLLVRAVADAVGRPAEQIDENAPLAQLGVDSLAAADVLLSMERELGRHLDDDLVTETATIVGLAEGFGEEPARDEGSA